MKSKYLNPLLCRGFFYILIFVIVVQNNVTAQLGYVIATKKAYKQNCDSNSNHKLVDIKSLGKTIFLDLKYSTTNNFTKTNLYTKATTTYLRQPAAMALAKICDSLASLGLFIKIWDAYRPYAATQLMWELIKDERYVANPKSGSNHNRGLAIDLTLVDKNGIEKNMGTSFDNFTDTAHHTFTNLSTDVLKNRKILKGIMEHYSFKALDTEWWHYSYAVAEKPPVVNLSFKQLKKIVK